MKTIAITIDEETLRLVDQIHRSSRRFRSRSSLIRAAIRDYAVRERERRSEAHERRVFRDNKRLLDRQLKALVKAQAKL
jgi:metal-responsive CopG/Arc/MetJ family transcriptional regulator